MIKKYEWAILIGFSLPLGPYKDIKDYEHYKRLLQTRLFAIERKAFLAGYYKAFCFFSGPCMLCHPKECRKRPTNIADVIRFRILGHQLPCRNPSMSRPAMEGCGINVYATAQKAELPIKVLTSRQETPHNYGLLLVT
jgi:predicted metal-binding protein